MNTFPSRQFFLFLTLRILTVSMMYYASVTLLSATYLTSTALYLLINVKLQFVLCHLLGVFLLLKPDPLHPSFKTRHLTPTTPKP